MSPRSRAASRQVTFAMQYICPNVKSPFAPKKTRMSSA